MMAADQHQIYQSAYESVAIETQHGLEQVSLDALQQLRQSLREKLAQDPVQYTALARELDASAVFIDGDRRAHIGAWQLSVQAGRPVLLRQQMPRTARMLFYVALLAKQDGKWRVEAIVLQKVQGL
ncbi:hypothetical protein [Comamonas sp. GB3 AK4-5]|uniref:hypothetical protein n=1 Tax=Comamonas sp. GB3 AK4-5 TaxID=3231487 RepID=UPI00351E865C